MITDISQPDLQRQYTYADYLTWRLKDRIELIFGRIFRMSPAPSSEHQQIVSALHGNIYQFVLPAERSLIIFSSGKISSRMQIEMQVECRFECRLNAG